MAFLWLPLAQNILQVQVFGSSVERSFGLTCSVVEEIQEFQGDSAEPTNYVFEAEAAVPGFRTGPVTFVVPTKKPNFSYGMYKARFDKTQSAWLICVPKLSRALLTFPTTDIFPDFSLSSFISHSSLEESFYGSLIVESFKVDSLEVEFQQTESTASSETSDLQSTSLTDTSLVLVDTAEEEEDMEKTTTATEEVSMSWAEVMDEEDEGQIPPCHQALPSIAEEPEPPEVSSRDICEQDNLELVEQGTAETTEDDESDENIYQAMINELEDPWKPDLRAFVPEDTTEAYDYFHSRVDIDKPENIDSTSWRWFQVCKDNAEWRHMLFASAWIRQTYCLKRPLLRASEQEIKRLKSVRPNTPTFAHSSQPDPYVPDENTHHRNMLGRCVNTPSTTPIEISFWATCSPALQNKFQLTTPLLHWVCASRAATWVDPFTVNSQPNLWNGSEWITGSASVSLVAGTVERVYFDDDLRWTPEDAKASSEVSEWVDFRRAQVKPISPLVVDYGETLWMDVNVNDDGRVHLPNKAKRDPPFRFMPTKLRHMRLCYEDTELPVTREDCAEKMVDTVIQEIGEVVTHQHETPQFEDSVESEIQIEVPARPTTRRMLRPRSARLVRRATTRPLTPRHIEHNTSDDESEAEIEIIFDSDRPATASPITVTRPAQRTPSNHVQTGVRVSEWLEVFTDSHAVNDEVLSPSHVIEDPLTTGAVDAAIEDEFLRRLAEESPQDIFTTEDDDSGRDVNLDDDGYSPTLQALDSPITDVSAYNTESSDGEQEYDKDQTCTAATREQTQGITTDLIISHGPATSEHVLPARCQEFHILPPVLARSLTLLPLSVPRQITINHMRSSTELVLYRPPIIFERSLRTAKPKLSDIGSKAITRKPGSDLHSIMSSQLFYSGILPIGRRFIRSRQKSSRALAPGALQPVTSTINVDTSSLKLSQASPVIIHDVELSSIPIIPFEDVSEIPTPSPSRPERLYGKINIAIGKAAIQAWKFLTPSSKDWSVNMGSAGGDDGYLWDRHNKAWGAFQFA